MNRRIAACINFEKFFYPRLLVVFLFLLQLSVFPQNSYMMSLENPAVTNNNIFEFDVFIKTAGNDFTLTSYQCALTFNVGNANNGTLSFSYITGTSGLENTPSYSVGVNNNDGVRKLTFASLVGDDIISSSPKKIGRFRLQNSEQFTSQAFEISWSFDGFVNTILTGQSHTDITNPANHANLVFVNEESLKLVSAAALNLTTVILSFSKQIEQTGANNASNYSVSNEISVTNALLSSDGITVTLTTSAHNEGQTYIVTASNITDINGNPIDPNANSQQYTQGSSDLFLNVKVFMEGPYSDGAMHASLNELEFIPLSQPFNISPWSYAGSETVTEIPENIVDWVFIELRSGISSSTIVKRQAVFINKEGFLVDLDGLSKVKVEGISQGNYYIVLRHRNHLAIMSSSKINISGNPSLYDFTAASGMAYGNDAQKSLGGSSYGMYCADGNGSGSVNNADANSVWKRENGKVGYYAGDFDMNGGVNIVDKNSRWKANNGKSSLVP